MSDTQLPGVFGDMQPLLEHYGYLAVGGFVLLEDFGVPVPGETMLIAAAVFGGSGHMNIALVILVAVAGAEHIVEIYAAFDRYKWYAIAAIVVVVAILITRRVRRRRTTRA